MVHAHVHRRHARNIIADVAVEALANAKREAAPAPAQTFVSIVYVTADPTFDGPVGGYTTVMQNDQVVQSAAAVTPDTPPTVPSSDSPVVNSKKASSQSPATTPTTLQTSTDLPSSIVSVSTSLDTKIPLLAATTPVSHLTSSTRSSTLSASSETTSPSSKTTDGGMGTGGKVGLALGLVLLIGTILALILFFVKKRRNAMKQGEQLNDEKVNAFAGAGRTSSTSTRTAPNAPRLSLRPVTQFIPNFGERRQSRGNALDLASSPAVNPNEKRSAWERPMGGQDTNRNNPFGTHAETIDSANANGPSVVNEVGPGAELLNAGTIGLARGASKRGVKPLDLTKSGPFMGPPSPSGTEFSMSSEGPNTPVQSSSSAAIAAAGGPANSAVHRVQLDFKPSMDDELELHAGQLIRMLHEYDDGWVSLLPGIFYSYINYYRLFAFVLIVLAKVLFLEHASQLVLSSLALSKARPVAHHHQACASQCNKAILNHPP